MARAFIALSIAVVITMLVVAAIFTAIPFVIDQLMIAVRNSAGTVILFSICVSVVNIFMSQRAAVYYCRKSEAGSDSATT